MITDKTINKNLAVLEYHLPMKNYECIKLPNSALIKGVRPVVVKATIEKLMNENKITPGRVIQYENCVIYTPNGDRMFSDRNYEI